MNSRKIEYVLFVFICALACVWIVNGAFAQDMPSQVLGQAVENRSVDVPILSVDADALVPLSYAASVEIPMVSETASSKGDRLVIPKLGINATILPMGLTPEGKMAVPDNFTEIGWYSYGTKPGKKGSSVMGAHVDDGGTVPGVFKNLRELSVGDMISVVQEDGKTLAFRVIDRKIYDANMKSTEEVFLQDDKVRLNLITCHGAWLPQKKNYAERLVVFTELVS